MCAQALELGEMDTDKVLISLWIGQALVHRKTVRRSSNVVAADIPSIIRFVR